jgi:hypothetical protein
MSPRASSREWPPSTWKSRWGPPTSSARSSADEPGNELGDVALEDRAVARARRGHVQVLAFEEIAGAHRLARPRHRAQQHSAPAVMDADLEQAAGHVVVVLHRVEQREQRRGVGREPA